MKLLSLVGTILSVFAVLFFLYLTISQSGVFVGIALNSHSVIALVFAIIIYICAMGVGAKVWHILLLSIGQRLTLAAAVSMVFLSQAAKYIPGNMAHHLGRVVLAKRHGLSVTNTLYTMFMESVGVVAIATLLALIVLMFSGNQDLTKVSHIPQWGILSVLLATAMMAPLIGHKLFVWATHWWSQHKKIEFHSVQIPPLSIFWLVGLLYIVNYLTLGLVLKVIASEVFGVEGGNFLLLSGIFAVAWVAGFITPGAPAGIGIREVVLVAALTPIYGKESAIGITAVLRCVTVLGDGMAFLIGLALIRISYPKTLLQ